jgi:hypothetical protein
MGEPPLPFLMRYLNLKNCGKCPAKADLIVAFLPHPNPYQHARSHLSAKISTDKQRDSIIIAHMERR